MIRIEKAGLMLLLTPAKLFLLDNGSALEKGNNQEVLGRAVSPALPGFPNAHPAQDCTRTQGGPVPGLPKHTAQRCQK